MESAPLDCFMPAPSRIGIRSGQCNHTSSRRTTQKYITGPKSIPGPRARVRARPCRRLSARVLARAHCFLFQFSVSMTHPRLTRRRPENEESAFASPHRRRGIGHRSPRRGEGAGGDDPRIPEGPDQPFSRASSRTSSRALERKRAFRVRVPPPDRPQARGSGRWFPNGFLIGQVPIPDVPKKVRCAGQAPGRRLRVVRYLRLPFPGSHNPPAATAGCGKAWRLGP